MSDTRTYNPWLAMTVLCLGLFITLLDLTIVNIAVPSISTGIHASLDQVLWVLNSYSLFYAVLLITFGRLGDVVGPRNMFAAGIVVFTLASAFSGLAQNPAELILSRGLQGLGAAILAPQGLPIMLSLFPVERRAGVFAIYGVLAGVAVLAGPLLGGWLVTAFGWRSIFYVNLPVGVLTLLLALVWVPDLRVGRMHRLDWVGVLFVSGGLLGIVFGLIEGERYSWGSVVGFVSIPLVLAAGVALVGVFLVQQTRRQGSEPLVPFAVFADHNFTLMALVLGAMGFSMLGVLLPLTIFLQSVLGLSAVAAGLTLAPWPLAMMLTSGIASSLSQKISGKYFLIPGLLLFAAGTAYIAWSAHADASRWTFLPGLVVSGLGLGFVWTPVYSLATRDLRPELGGVASGVINTIQELGAVIASAAVGALLQNRLAAALHDQAIQYSASLPAEARSPFVAAFSTAAKNGLQVGTGQTGTKVGLPPGLPSPLAAQIQHVATLVFTHGFSDAMRATLPLTVAVVVLAAVAAGFARATRLAQVAQPVGDDATSSSTQVAG